MSWRVEEGADVEVNAPLCDVETAKAVVVIPSPIAGSIRKLHARPGESVDVGAPLVTIASAAGAAEPTPRGRWSAMAPAAGPNPVIRRRPGRTAAAGEQRATSVPRPSCASWRKNKGVDLARSAGAGRAAGSLAPTSKPPALPAAERRPRLP